MGDILILTAAELGFCIMAGKRNTENSTSLLCSFKIVVRRDCSVRTLGHTQLEASYLCRSPITANNRPSSLSAVLVRLSPLRAASCSGCDIKE